MFFAAFVMLRVRLYSLFIVPALVVIHKSGCPPERRHTGMDAGIQCHGRYLAVLQGT